MNRKKNLDFSIVNDDTTLRIHQDIVELHKRTDSWVEAVTTYCEDQVIDIEDIVDHLSSAIKANLYDEAIINKTIVDDEPTLADL